MQKDQKRDKRAGNVTAGYAVAAGASPRSQSSAQIGRRKVCDESVSFPCVELQRNDKDEDAKDERMEGVHKEPVDSVETVGSLDGPVGSL